MSTEEAICDVVCQDCGSENFELKAVDEWNNDQPVIYLFCSGCGKSMGKMYDMTVDIDRAEYSGNAAPEER